MNFIANLLTFWIPIQTYRKSIRKNIKKNIFKFFILHSKKFKYISSKIDQYVCTAIDPRKAVYIMQLGFLNNTGTDCYMGGAERYCLDISKIIEKFGYKVFLFQLGDKKLKDDFWIKKYENITIIGINHNVENYYGIISLLTSPKLVIYSGITNWFNPHKSSILISHGITWDHPQQNANFKEIYESLELANELVSVDTNTISWFRSSFSNTLQNKNLKMTYIPNYVNLNEYQPSDNKIDKNITITFPRRLSPERGFWLIADTLSSILDKHDNVIFEFIGYIHGDNIKDKLNSLIEKYPNRIKHYLCDSKNMPIVYKRADITLIPTLYSEGTSLSCIEAMASGNAIIATNIGGLPNLIINNFNGILINPDKDELFNAISKLIQDAELREKLKKNAIMVSKEFSKTNWDISWQNVLSKYL